MNKPVRNTEELPAVGSPVERGVRPHAWIDDSGHPKHLRYVQGVRERQLYGPLRPLYEVPPDLMEYLLRHLQHKRAELVGFTKLGNEVGRAKRLDDWIAGVGA